MISKTGMYFVILMLPAMAVATAAQPSIGSQRVDGVLFLNGNDVAAALDLEFKVVQPGSLVTFCRKGNESFCIPIHLTDSNHQSSGSETFISAASLSRPLRFTVVTNGDSIRIKSKPASTARDESAGAYNADWAEGRGFREGNTLPDIPLVDLEGNEVRFSQFLGKRYILYCWASW
jgi:hypothetical protein